jgi:hypothetical protein
MNGIILDSFKENSSECYLVKLRLGEYIKGLPDSYRSYEVQREIVKNTYLDKLINTILEQQHIPPIVLVLEKKTDFTIKGTTISIKYFKILDGLQRTYRLKVIYETMELFEKEFKLSKEILGFSRLQVSKKYKSELEKIESNSTIFFKIIEYFNNKQLKSVNSIHSLFDTIQWFEIWTNLTPDEEVEKMLVLNAGHKPVKTKHQLELLFRHILPIIQKQFPGQFTLIREKEPGSAKFSRERKIGQFQFATLITTILSLSQGRPLTSNIDLIQKKQSDYFDDEIFDVYMSYSFLSELIRVLLTIDRVLQKQYKEIGIKWMGRETSLVGMFAAVGKLKEERELTPLQAIKLLETKISENPKALALQEFENARNSQDLAKINIGNVNKRAVYNGLHDILAENSNKIKWLEYFKGE